MTKNLAALLAGLLFLFTANSAFSDTPTNSLRVYGPGGPHKVLEECAQLFTEKHGTEVIVKKALPHDLDDLVTKRGDIYYGGAPYMLEEFNNRNPGVLNQDSVEHLYPRQIGIVVRKGNPYGIMGLECLTRDGVGLLDVKLENMRQLHGVFDDNIKNLESMVYTGRQGLNEWLSNRDIDAWVTYRSWYFHLEDEAEFVEISKEKALRSTPIALTNHTRYPLEANNFIEFLKTDEAYKIFQKHGWN